MSYTSLSPTSVTIERLGCFYYTVQFKLHCKILLDILKLGRSINNNFPITI